MLHRAASLIQADARRVWGGTFHHVGNLILRRYGNRIGYEPNFTILDREDAADLVTECIRLAGFDPKEKYFPRGRVLESIFAMAADTDRGVSETVLGRYSYLANRLGEIEQIAVHYEERKKEIQAVDFSGLLRLTRDLLAEHEDVRRELQARFRYILVDEYQDTNKVQADLVDFLAGEQKNVTVVGDDAQSIYSFRGAHFENIITFPERYPDARLFRLEENYRSTASILALANASISHNKRQFKKNLKTTRSEGMKPALVATRDAMQQADFVVDRTLALRDEEDVQLSQIAGALPGALPFHGASDGTHAPGDSLRDQKRVALLRAAPHQGRHGVPAAGGLPCGRIGLEARAQAPARRGGRDGAQGLGEGEGAGRSPFFSLARRNGFHPQERAQGF